MSLAVASSRTCGFANGTALRQKSARRQTHRIQNRIAGPVRAKYGDESQFFDLEDLENSVGSWDLYGQEDDKRYPSLQAEFFERAAAPLERRESLIALVAVSGILSILTWGAKGSKDVALPITVGPKGGGEKGPRGKI
eukprot:jgi/Botrbrau1/11500/Bobra.0360s0020.1